MENIVKKAFREAKKDAEKKQVDNIKKVIQATLEKLESKKKEMATLSKEIKVLKKDIGDFREGRLDKIEERQKKDEEAVKISVVRVIKIIEEKAVDNYWYQPYRFEWYSGHGDNGVVVNDSVVITSGGTGFTTCASSTANATSGTYVLDDGAIKYID